MNQTQQTFNGEWAAGECKERLNALRLERLVEALKIAGVRAGTIPYKLALLIFHVTKTTNGRLEWTNRRIAVDGGMAKRNGSAPREPTIKAAASKLRSFGIIGQQLAVEIGIEHAVRWIDHARVLQIIEFGSAKIFDRENDRENEGDSDRENEGDSEGEKTGSLYSCFSFSPRVQESSIHSEPIPCDEEEDSCLDSETKTQAAIQADVDYFASELNVQSQRDRALLTDWVSSVHRGKLPPDVFLAYLELIRDKHRAGLIKDRFGYLKKCIESERKAAT